MLVIMHRRKMNVISNSPYLLLFLFLEFHTSNIQKYLSIIYFRNYIHTNTQRIEEKQSKAILFSALFHTTVWSTTLFGLKTYNAAIKLLDKYWLRQNYQQNMWLTLFFILSLWLRFRISRNAVIKIESIELTKKKYFIISDIESARAQSHIS